MTRTAIISSTALATLLGAALPAMAQAPVPAPMYAPAPPPMMAPPPAPMPMPEVAPALPVAVAAPRAADDMTGSVGFGVGVVAGSTGSSGAAGATAGSLLIAPDTGNLMMKYWMSDSLAIMPMLSLQIHKVKGSDASWSIAPAAVALFNLLKGASTRFDAGLGLGFFAGKTPPATDTTIGIAIPVVLNVEHFFTRWFSMGVGAQFDLLKFGKTGDYWEMNVELSNVNYMGSLFFYTD
jgi:hypothetical protein